tara:strand:+ start:5659 stop:6549 length:891 start_codon:yes stop_codon:yes gene_type:complete
MIMPERAYSATPDGYRFGFNGMEKDDEVKGSGNSYSTEFRQLDVRLGRWLTIDPKASVLPSHSPYLVMGGNPILYVDPNGDIFKIGIKDKQARSDVKSLTKKRNQQYVKIDDSSGDVSLDFGNLKERKIKRKIKRDKGLGIIHDLSTGKDKQGNDLNFFYGTQGPIGARDRTTGDPLKSEPPFPFLPPGSVTTSPNFMINLSTTPYTSNNPHYLPKEGYDGQVAIAPGIVYANGVTKVKNASGGYTTTTAVIVVARSEVVYHELRENYLRTAHKLPYPQAHQQAGGRKNIVKFKFK